LGLLYISLTVPDQVCWLRHGEFKHLCKSHEDWSFSFHLKQIEICSSFGLVFIL